MVSNVVICLNCQDSNLYIFITFTEISPQFREKRGKMLCFCCAHQKIADYLFRGSLSELPLSSDALRPNPISTPYPSPYPLPLAPQYRGVKRSPKK